MLSKIWTVFLLISLLCGIMTDRMAEVTNAVTTGTAEAVTLSLRILGIMSLWSGFLELLSRAGVTQRLAVYLHPILRLLFGDAAKDTKAMDAVSANIAANLLGLSNAATPMGLLAAERLYALGNHTQNYTAVYTLILLNTTSLQLFPTTVAAIRAEYGAAMPYDILPAVWGASAGSVAVVLLLAFLQRSRWKNRNKEG